MLNYWRRNSQNLGTWTPASKVVPPHTNVTHAPTLIDVRNETLKDRVLKSIKINILLVFSVTQLKIDQNEKSKPFDRLSPESGNEEKVDMQRLSPRTSVTHSAIASWTTFLFLPHFDVICDLLLNRRTATWNLFVKCTCTTVWRDVVIPGSVVKSTSYMRTSWVVH